MTMGQVTNGTTKMGLKVVNPSKRTLQRRAKKAAAEELLGKAHAKQPSERTLRYHRQKARIAAAAVAAVQEARAVDKAIEVDLNFSQVTSGPETHITGGSFDFSHQMVDPDVLALNSLTETLGARGVMQLIRRSVA